MRVLHVLPTGAEEYGGPVRVAQALCGHLVRRGHMAEVFAPSGHRRLAYWPGVSALRVLQSKIRSSDLVHIHGLWTVPTSAAAVAAQTFSRPFVVTPHGMLDRWSLRHHGGRKKIYAALLERRNLDAAVAVHFFNREEREEAQAFGIRAPSFLLPNGVDIEQFTGLTGREALWIRHPALANKKTLLFLGRLHPKKGIPLLIEALARLGPRHPDVHLLIAGPDEGGHRGQLESLVRKHGVAERVVFAGPVMGDEKRTLLGGADLFALPSHQEGDSVAVKEALAAGLPVIITHACHFPEVGEAGAGLVVRPEVEELAAAIDKLCGDDALRRRMASRARPLIECRYRWETLADQLIEFYEEALARSRLQGRAAIGGVR